MNLDIHLDKFALRHFARDFSGTKVLDMDPDQFIDHLLSYDMELIDSKMDFCKYIIISNFTDAKSGSEEITEDNLHYLRSGYSSRVKGELPVLNRWFELPDTRGPAKYLQLVLYSKEQLIKESISKGESPDLNLKSWNIIAILGQNSGMIEPMSPITMMRNALGMEEGGNGVPLSKEEYAKSVEFWSKYANVK